MSGFGAYLEPNTSDAEDTNVTLSVSATGFKLLTSWGDVNASGGEYVYVACRRPDGYVGKPPELGTDVFNMPLGLTDGTKPAFNTGFPVDFLIYKKPAVSGDWFTGARLIGTNYLEANNNVGQSTNANIQWDFQDGMGGWSGLSSGYQSWGFKRHAGFDCICYKGTGTTHQIAHSLNKTVEMFWLKSRDSSANWMVWHKGLNGGTNPEQYFIRLNLTNAESQGSSFGDTAPTSTHFTVGASSNAINTDGDDCIAMLFASVDGISKVGSYTGNGSTTERTITLGFQPRFIIIKNADGDYGNSWEVLDTTRGWGSGNDKRIWLDGNWAQDDSINVGAPTSTGFTLTTDYTGMNANNNTYIYYAHA